MKDSSLTYLWYYLYKQFSFDERNHDLKLFTLNHCASNLFADFHKKAVQISFPILSRSNQFSLLIYHTMLCFRRSESKGRSITIFCNAIDDLKIFLCLLRVSQILPKCSTNDFAIISRSNQFSLHIKYIWICSRTIEFKGRSIIIYFSRHTQSYE